MKTCNKNKTPVGDRVKPRGGSSLSFQQDMSWESSSTKEANDHPLKKYHLDKETKYE